MNLTGLLIGVISFLIIGIFHPIVIKSEYYWGTRCWPLFLLGGLISLTLSIWVSSLIASAILGVLGFSFLWSILELFHQRKRVEKGWFPKNPKKSTTHH